MLIRDRGYQRGVELGPWPLELLQVAADVDTEPLTKRARPDDTNAPSPQAIALSGAVEFYSRVLLESASQEPAERAVVPDDLVRRSQEIKGAIYYLDASHAGVCAIPDIARISVPEAHSHAIAIVVGFGIPIEDDNLARNWIGGSEHDIAQMRAIEIGSSIAGHIRAMGFDASTHLENSEDLDVDRVLLASGVGVKNSSNQVVSAFIDDQFATVVVTTEYELAADSPIDPKASVNPVRDWLGANGAMSSRERRRLARRASHLSKYPMEQVRRIDEPTTKIFSEEVPRVPNRAAFFNRARAGDLGDKAQREVARFSFKHPLTDGMMHPLRSMVPHQDGELAREQTAGFDDAEANTRAIKSLSYHLGADLTGICEVPRYAWYSHNGAGKEIEMKHRYAVVMLIDQGYDTMEGASGDDWISGCQSMRGYMRGAEVAGVMAEFLRRNGISSRPQTNADSEVLQIPLVLLAGLGELSRIGELVLNPFVGPRFKSVVLTTDLPLVPDKPIDFGLQKFCQSCLKCARECPVNAIPFGDKVVFNGYEIWKPDVERCTRYRVTNPKGSACGRCMKMCPLNKVVTADGALTHRIGSWLGVNAMWLKPVMIPIAVWLDDKLGYGRRNPVKRWWLDLELVDGRAQVPSGTNERDLDLDGDTSGAKSPIGYYHAQDNPPPDAKEAFPVNRRDALARAELVETVEEAVARRERGDPIPVHFHPRR